MYLLIVYDIREDKRRIKIDKALSAYGFRVNYSVFEVHLKSEAKLMALKEQLVELMDIKVDSVRLYHFDKHTVVKAQELGDGPEPFVQESGFVL